MTSPDRRWMLIASCVFVASCGGGSSDDSSNELADPLVGDSIVPPYGISTLIDDPLSGSVSSGAPGEDTALAAFARYQVTLLNFWGVEDYPQGFPDNAHLSLIGGATHNAAVSFWGPGEVASRGIEDIAEAGLIDKLLFDEVAPAISNGTADSMIEIREFTGAKIDGVAGIIEFELTLKKGWPRVSMATMLGPSPDWFIGVAGLSL